MDQKERLAIIGSIEKWNGICMNAMDPVKHAMCSMRCDLCYYSGAGRNTGPNCKLCPLYKAGDGCLVANSTWDILFGMCSENKLYIDSCEQMYNSVCALLPDDDKYWR